MIRAQFVFRSHFVEDEARLGQSSRLFADGVHDFLNLSDEGIQVTPEFTKFVRASFVELATRSPLPSAISFERIGSALERVEIELGHIPTRCECQHNTNRTENNSSKVLLRDSMLIDSVHTRF